MSRRNNALQRAFTFLEILAAMLFMAIVIPVAVEGLVLANTVNERAARKRFATDLAERTLNESLATDSWRNGDQDGDYGDDWPGYRWGLASEAWPEDTMRLVTVEVSYSVQEREFTERLSTLANELSDSGEAEQ